MEGHLLANVDIDWRTDIVQQIHWWIWSLIHSPPSQPTHIQLTISDNHITLKASDPTSNFLLTYDLPQLRHIPTIDHYLVFINSSSPSHQSSSCQLVIVAMVRHSDVHECQAHMCALETTENFKPTDDIELSRRSGHSAESLSKLWRTGHHVFEAMGVFVKVETTDQTMLQSFDLDKQVQQFYLQSLSRPRSATLFASAEKNDVTVTKQSYLIVIGHYSILLIDPISKLVVKEIYLSEILCVQQGLRNRDHFGIVFTSSKSYTKPTGLLHSQTELHVFQCIDTVLCEDMLKMMQQSHNSYLQWSKSCRSCPIMLWNELCSTFNDKFGSTLQPDLTKANAVEMQSCLTKFVCETLACSFDQAMPSNTPKWQTEIHFGAFLFRSSFHLAAKQQKQHTLHDWANGQSVITLTSRPSVSQVSDNESFSTQRRRSSSLDSIETSDLSKTRSSHRLHSVSGFAPDSLASIRETPSISRQSSSLGSMEPVFDQPMSVRVRIFKSIVATRSIRLVVDYPEWVQSPREEESVSFETSRRSKYQLMSMWRRVVKEIISLNRLSRSKMHPTDFTDGNDNTLFSQLIPVTFASSQAYGLAHNTWRRLLASESPVSWSACLQAAQLGFPPPLRQSIWQLLFAHRERSQNELNNSSANSVEKNYRRLLTSITPHQHSILIDVGRTFPKHDFFTLTSGGQMSLFNVLKAYSLADPVVGYCQGLSFVAAIMLLQMNEEDAFRMLVNFMFVLDLRSLFKADMEKVQECLYQFARLLHERSPQLFHHLEELDVLPSLYVSPWFLSLFATQYPIPFVIRVLDLILCFGLEAVFRVGLLLLQHCEAHLLTLKTFEDTADYIKQTLPNLTEDEQRSVFDKAYLLPLHHDLTLYGIEYRVLRDAENDIHATQVQMMNREWSRHMKEVSVKLVSTNSLIESQQSEIHQLLERERALIVTVSTLQEREKQLTTLLHDIGAHMNNFHSLRSFFPPNLVQAIDAEANAFPS